MKRSLFLFVRAVALGALLMARLQAGAMSNPNMEPPHSFENNSKTVSTFDIIAGPKFRKIALNGQPLSDEKPQQAGETDQEPEESYVDALTLRLNHSTTDVYVPLPGGELSLSVRRNTTTEIFNGRDVAYCVQPISRLDRPFGSNWSSNLTPMVEEEIHLSGLPSALDQNPPPPHHKMDTVSVVDENGASYRFIATANGFSPFPTSRYEQDTLQCSLVASGNNLVFIRKFGTTLTFTPAPALTVKSPDDFYEGERCKDSNDGSTPDSTVHVFWRLQKVVDRFGNQLTYDYGDSPSSPLRTLIPATISAQNAAGQPLQHLTITRSADLLRVMAVTDPNGKTHTYSYTSLSSAADKYNHNHTLYAIVTGNGQLEPPNYDPPELYFPRVTVLSSVAGPGSNGSAPPVTTYTYQLYTDTDNTPPPKHVDPRYVYKTIPHHCEITSITDPNRNKYSFDYKFDISRTVQTSGDMPSLVIQTGIPQNVVKVTAPNGTSMTLANMSGTQFPFPFGNSLFTPSGQQKSMIVDALGNARVYDFGEMHCYLVSASGSHAFGTEQIEYLRAYSGLQITYYAGLSTVTGQETFTFNEQANMALQSATDLSGNMTTYQQSDAYVLPVGGLLANNRYSIYYADPTLEIAPPLSPGARGFTKTFSYTPLNRFRIMTSMVEADASGSVQRRTTYQVNSLGLRTQEDIAGPSGVIEQTTKFVYGNPSFPAFMTAKILVNFKDQSKNLETDYVADALGRVAKQIEAPQDLKLTTTYTYDSNNNKLSSTDPNGHTTGFVYDALNHLIEVDNPDSTKKLYAYDARGNKVSETDENGHQTLFAYDTLNRMTSSTRVLASGNLVTSYTYNNANSKLTVTDPNKNVTSMAYDNYQRLVKTTDPQGQVTTYAYGTNSGGNPFDSSSFKPTHVVDRNGYATDVIYDNLYRPISTSVQYSKSPVAAATTVKEYDIFNNVTKVTDPLLKVTIIDYDALNRPVQTTVASGTIDAAKTTMVYNSIGEEISMTDPLGRVTTNLYDNAKRKSDVFAPAVDDGAGHVVTPHTQTIFDPVGNTLATINPLGNRWDFQYDSRNRKTQELDPAVLDAEHGNVSKHPLTAWTYDGVGNQISMTDPRGFVQTKTYDEANRLTSTVMADGTPYAATTSSKYDFDGNVVAVTDPDGHVTSNSYDSLNRLIQTVDAAGNTVRNGYDPEGNRTSVTDPLQHATSFTYDGLKRNTGMTDPLGKTTTFQFDGVNKVARVDANGAATYYGYNNRHKLTQVSYATRAQDNRVYTYDLVDNLLTVTESDPSRHGRSDVAYSYDDLNRITKETSGGVTHQYAYDLSGNRLTTFYGNGGVKLFSTYDALNRLSTLAEGDGVTFARTSGYGYDLSGNIVQKTLPNGELTQKSYDGLDRVLVITDKAPNGQVEYSYIQTYDLAGNVLKIAETYGNASLNRTVTNSYDAIYRLTNESAVGAGAYTAAYNYDRANNRLRVIRNGAATTYTYNAVNQLTTATGAHTATYTYDANGNRLTRTIGGVSDQYQYDVENRLINLVVNSTFEVSNAGAPSSLALGNYNYQYDYRTRRVLRDESQAAGNITTVIFSGGTSVQEIEQGAITVQYIRGSDYGGGIGGIWYTLRNGNPSYTHYNSRGDVVAKTDNAATVTYQALYEAYGKRTVETGNTLDRQKANTKDEDPTGLLDEGWRYRDLDTGVFLTKDPAGFVNGPNIYTYVEQNPWTKFDPEGLDDNSPPPKENVVQRVVKSATAGINEIKKDVGEKASAVEDGYRNATDPSNSIGTRALGLAETALGGLSIAGDVANAGLIATGIGDIAAAGLAVAKKGVQSVLEKTAQDVVSDVAKAVENNATKEVAKTSESSVSEETVSQVTKNQAAGNQARDELAESRPGSLTEQNFRVTGGLRRVDVLDGTTALESKVGRTGLTAPVRQELARDVKMIRSGQVDAVEWHFSTSPTTGLRGPTVPLRAKLQKFGIPIVEH